jgi:hypothetical protein
MEQNDSICSILDSFAHFFLAFQKKGRKSVTLLSTCCQKVNVVIFIFWSAARRTSFNVLRKEQYVPVPV